MSHTSHGHADQPQIPASPARRSPSSESWSRDSDHVTVLGPKQALDVLIAGMRKNTDLVDFHADDVKGWTLKAKTRGNRTEIECSPSGAEIFDRPLRSYVSVAEYVKSRSQARGVKAEPQAATAPQILTVKVRGRRASCMA